MKIAVGSDHAGFMLKEKILQYLKDQSIECTDFGVFSLERSDYTDAAICVAEAVADGRFDRGILVCGTGIGMSIAANKVRGIRAALCTDCYTARMTREHNDSNILTLGERVTGCGSALDIVGTWLSTPFGGDPRNVQRIGKVSEIDNKYRQGGS